MRSLSSAGDLILLNLLLILFCLPVVTAGAAWAAGYASLLRIVRGEEQGFPFKPFWKDFRKSFRTATLGWLIQLVCLAVMAGDYYYAVYQSDPPNQFFWAFSIIMTAVLLLIAVWLYPLIARFNNTVRGHIKNAVLMAVGMFPRTLLALAIQLSFLLLPLLISDLFTYFGWLWVCFGLSLPMLLTAKLFRKPLQSMPIKPDEDAPTVTDGTQNGWE